MEDETGGDRRKVGLRGRHKEAREREVGRRMDDINCGEGGGCRMEKVGHN